MSNASDAFHAEMDYLWRAVGEAQESSARAETERARAKAGLEENASRLRRLEKALELAGKKERELKGEIEALKAAAARDAGFMASAARQAREAGEAQALKLALQKKDNEAALLANDITALKAEAAALREAVAGREAVIESLKEKLTGLTSLPELAKTLKEDARLSGKQRSVYEHLVERLEKGKRSAAEAAGELARAAAEAEASRAALAAAEKELAGLRGELALKAQELSGLEAALAEAAAREKISAEEKAALEGRAAGLKAALAEKETLLDSSVSACEGLKRDLAAAAAETERLKAAAEEQALKTQEQKANFTGAVGQVFDLQNRARELRAELARAQEQNAALSAALKQREEDIEKVNGLLRDSKNSLAAEKESTRRAAIKIKSLETEIEALKAKITAAGDYSARLLKAVEERDLTLGAIKAERRADQKRIDAVEAENEELRRKSIKFAGFLQQEQADFNSRIIAAMEKAVKDFKTFNLRIPAAERKALEPAMKNLFASVNLLKGWQEYMDPETPELADTDLAPLVSGETAKWERAFKQRKLSVTAAVANPRLRARVSTDRLKMLFYHLIKNAYEHLPSGGSLRVYLKSSEDGRQAVITFEDNGPGFARETLDKLYAPFNTTDKGRVGIGLAVARRIAEKHGGTLEASNRKERGAVVEVRLPLGATAPQP